MFLWQCIQRFLTDTANPLHKISIAQLPIFSTTTNRKGPCVIQPTQQAKKGQWRFQDFPRLLSFAGKLRIERRSL